MLLSYFSKPIVENYLNVSEITEKQQQRIAGRFQNFVKENHIKIKELDKIENWIKKEPYVYLKLYYNDTLIFDSISNLKKDSLKEQKNNDKISDLNTLNPYYEIEFDNATALALFYCLTYYRRTLVTLVVS